VNLSLDARFRLRLRCRITRYDASRERFNRAKRREAFVELIRAIGGSRRAPRHRDVSSDSLVRAESRSLVIQKGRGGEPCVTSRWRRPTVAVSTRTVNAITHAIRRAEGFKRTSAHESRRAWPRDGSVTSAIYLGGDISPPHTHTPSPSAFTRRAEILSETRTRVRSLARAAKFVRLCGEGGEGDVFTSSRTRSPSIREGGGAFLGSGILPGDDATLATPRVASFRRKVTLRLNRTFDRGGRRRLSGSRQSQVDREILRRLRRR